MFSNRVLGLCGVLSCLWLVGCASDDKPIEATDEPSLEGTLCDGQAGLSAVAPSADGTRVAFVSCSGSSPAVIVHDLATHDEVNLGEVPDGSSVEWLPSARSDEPQKYLLYGLPSELWVRAADASTDAVRVAEGDSGALHRAILQRISDTEFAPRLHVLSAVEGTLTLSVRDPHDDYATATELYAGSDILPDLSQISGSGRTVILTPTEEDQGYVQVQWNTNKAMWQTSTLSFGPADWVMAPVGLGDTHNFALHGDQLVRVELKTGAIEEIVASGEGLLDGTAHLVDREDAPGTKYVYYILNGDPTRRDRDGKMAPETLAEANAVAQQLTPDESTLLYLTDGELRGVPAEGGAAQLLVDRKNETGRIDAAFAGSGSAFVYTVGGTVYRVDLADGTASELSGVSVEQGSVTYDGLGTAILFLDEAGNLVSAPDSTLSPETVATSVTNFWPVPKSAKILAVSDGVLRLYPADAP
ncbi:MAG TPA: hypothetical protein VG937_15360 [Polyangiaceae bacterium]|nr:hypothetical protein [Polyangiaceae bacterium]